MYGSLVYLADVDAWLGVEFGIISFNFFVKMWYYWGIVIVIALYDNEMMPGYYNVDELSEIMKWN